MPPSLSVQASREARMVPHALALGGLLLLSFAVAANLGAGKPEWARDVRNALNVIDKQDLFAHVSILASDDYEGRAAGEKGGRLAGDYIAYGFKKFGLAPGGTDGTYFQPVPIPGKPEAEWGRNVIGIYRAEGVDPAVEEAVVIGAHYDHLGFARQSQRLTLGTTGKLHNGADDNASGTAGLLEIAAAFTSKKVKVKRSIIFMSFDAEELGLLGSRHYVSQPTFPLERTRAMLNIDMISRNKPTEMYYGQLDKFAPLNELLKGIAGRFRIELNTDGMAEYVQRSDQWAFMQRDIPACFLFGGMHPDYHTEHDDADRVDPLKMQEVARLLFLFAYECAQFDGSFHAPVAEGAQPAPPTPPKSDALWQGCGCGR